MGVAEAYMGAGWPPGVTVYGVEALYIDESSAWLLAGDTPDIWLGEFQLAVVAGDVAGESSVFKLRPAFGRGGAGMASMPPGCFFRWERCFSSMLRRPSLVKGFGSTSFMPIYVSIFSIFHMVMKEVHVPCWKYIEMSSLRIFEVIAMIGVLSNCLIR